MDQEGYINIVGRIKDMIIRGGENVYPREIEEFLYTHPKISDVQVIGIPDPKYGEEIMAWIKVKPGEQITEVPRPIPHGHIAEPGRKDHRQQNRQTRGDATAREDKPGAGRHHEARRELVTDGGDDEQPDQEQQQSSPDGLLGRVCRQFTGKQSGRPAPPAGQAAARSRRPYHRRDRARSRRDARHPRSGAAELWREGAHRGVGVLTGGSLTEMR